MVSLTRIWVLEFCPLSLTLLCYVPHHKHFQSYRTSTLLQVTFLMSYLDDCISLLSGPTWKPSNIFLLEVRSCCTTTQDSPRVLPLTRDHTSLIFSWPLSVTLCSTHSSQAILTCLLFLEHSRNVSPMWPLYLLFLWNTLRSWLKRNFPIIYFKWEIHFSSICGLLSWLYFST